MAESPDEASLVRKLVTTWHLNVPERRALPDGKARASLVRAVIEEALGSAGFFPGDARPDAEFNGGMLEARADGTYRLSWSAEVSMCRYEIVSVEDFASRREAVDAFMARSYGGDIDGVPLDWSG